MPLLVDPAHDRAYIWLKRHEKLPIRSRPLFVVRNMSGRDRRAYVGKLEALKDIPRGPEGNQQYHESLLALLGEYVVGWKNIDDPETGKPAVFSVDKFNELSGNNDLYEIAYSIPTAIEIDDEILGESTSPAATATEHSASSAPAEATAPAQ